MTFGERLLELRRSRGWSRRKLADKVRGGAVTERAIKALETIPGRQPRRGTLLALSEVLPELQFN